jgi:PTS system beta-glucosides-specific IIC component
VLKDESKANTDVLNETDGVVTVVKSGGTYNILYSLGDSVFYFMPILLGYTAAKRFGIDEFVGIILGATMVYPTMTSSGGADISNFLKIPVVMPATGDYTSTVIPVIVAVWITSYIYKF